MYKSTRLCTGKMINTLIFNINVRGFWKKNQNKGKNKKETRAPKNAMR